MVHLVMEFITEKTFKQWIGTPEASDPKFLQKVARQLVDVLAYLHDQRILHNDIKPPNILVSDSGLVQLIDYGLAMTSRSKGNTNVVGSPVYESPEKLAGCYKNGADWYALAVTLLEVKNGVHPFENIKSLEGLKLTVVYGLPKSKDPVFNDFIQKIGHVDPDLRWSHGNGKIDDIRNHPFLKNSYDPAESKTPADTVPEIVALETISLTDGAVATLDDVQ
jgi:serine/threonine protein kinase